MANPSLCVFELPEEFQPDFDAKLLVMKLDPSNLVIGTEIWVELDKSRDARLLFRMVAIDTATNRVWAKWTGHASYGGWKVSADSNGPADILPFPKVGKFAEVNSNNDQPKEIAQ